MPKSKRVVLPEPHQTPWMHYALRALHQWFEYDEPGSHALWKGETDLVRKWMWFYRIARNYVGLQSLIDELVKIVQAAAKEVRDKQGSDEALVLAVHEVSEAIDQTPRVSAASKLLYLAQPEYGVIFDRNARIALGMPLGVEYSDFLKRWKSVFDEKQPQIREGLAATADLPDPAFPLGLADAQRCRSLLKRDWFERRVFDIYLWHEGKRLGG